MTPRPMLFGPHTINPDSEDLKHQPRKHFKRKILPVSLTGSIIYGEVSGLFECKSFKFFILSPNRQKKSSRRVS